MKENKEMPTWQIIGLVVFVLLLGFLAFCNIN